MKKRLLIFIALFLISVISSTVPAQEMEENMQMEDSQEQDTDSDREADDAQDAEDSEEPDDVRDAEEPEEPDNAQDTEEPEEPDNAQDAETDSDNIDPEEDPWNGMTDDEILDKCWEIIGNYDWDFWSGWKEEDLKYINWLYEHMPEIVYDPKSEITAEQPAGNVTQEVTEEVYTEEITETIAEEEADPEEEVSEETSKEENVQEEINKTEEVSADLEDRKSAKETGWYDEEYEDVLKSAQSHSVSLEQMIDARATGKKIHELRVKKKISMRSLSQAIGYADIKEIFYLETGKKVPSREEVLILALTFEVSPEEILIYQ